MSTVLSRQWANTRCKGRWIIPLTQLFSFQSPAVAPTWRDKVLTSSMCSRSRVTLLAPVVSPIILWNVYLSPPDQQQQTNGTNTNNTSTRHSGQQTPWKVVSTASCIPPTDTAARCALQPRAPTARLAGETGWPNTITSLQDCLHSVLATRQVLSTTSNFYKSDNRSSGIKALKKVS